MEFVKKYFRYIFYILLAANGLVINKMHEHHEVLVNSYAPRGMVSLELNFSQIRQDSILKIWDSTEKSYIIQGTGCEKTNPTFTGTQVATTRNDWDYLFIFLYTLFLFVFCIRLYPFTGPSPGFRTVLVCILLICIMDITENLFIASALTHHNTPAWYIWLPSLIKWIIRSCIGIYFLIQMYVQGMIKRVFQTFSNYLSGTIVLVWTFRIPFFCLMILFLALYGMDQGRDLLLIINSSPLGPITFILTLSILALLNWYLSKLYVPVPLKNVTVGKYIRGNWPDSREMNKNQFDGARLMGSLTFLVPMISILNAMRIFGIPYPLQVINPFILLLVILGFYQLALYYNWISHWFTSEGRVNKKRFFALVGIVLIYILLVPFFDSDKPAYLVWLSLDLLLLSFIFLVYTTIRTCSWGNLNRRTNRISARMTPWIIWPGLILMAVFVLANIYPRLFYFNSNLRLLTLPVIISALCFYNILFSYILFKGKTLRIQFISFIFLAGLLISILKENDLHRLTPVKTENKFKYTDSLSGYMESWFLHRKKEIDSFYKKTGSSYPVFIINAYGGGIRAAAWTTFVISELEKQSGGRNRSFQHYVLAYSGASGGTIGFSELCAARYSLKQALLPGDWQQLYENDFLTPLIIALFGRDAWNSSSGFRLAPDRSILQEDIWERCLAQKQISYDSPFVKYWDSAGSYGMYEVPLLFANTYLADSGLKAITSPVRLSHRNFPGTVFVEDLLQNDTASGIKLSTGAFLSARFPFISPTGKLDQTHHFMDGGLKENSGAETAREILSVLFRKYNQLSKSDTTWGKINIVLISLPNSIAGTDSIQTAPNFFELTAPLTALMNNWVGNTNKADTINARNVDGYLKYDYYQLRPSATCLNGFKPVLPLGWQISDYALDQMKSSLDSIRPELNEILEKIPHK